MWVFWFKIYQNFIFPRKIQKVHSWRMTVTEILSQSEFHEALKNNQLVAVHFHSGYIPKSELMIKEFKRLAGKNPAKFLMVFWIFRPTLFKWTISHYTRLLEEQWPTRIFLTGKPRPLRGYHPPTRVGDGIDFNNCKTIQSIRKWFNFTRISTFSSKTPICS